ncbi:cell division protein FtsQ [Bacteroidia bacterium]|nr:cell division protein FtsQ [Bacteroidia bacterium]
MTKKNRTILQFSLLAVFAGYLIFALVYAQDKRKSTICNDLEINVISNSNNKFITKDDITAEFQANDLNYFGKNINELPVAAMEKLITKNNFVKSANVYASMDGVLHVDIVQRKPILRVYTRNGNNFYIDDEGFIFYIDNNYSCYVPIVSGNLKPPFHIDFVGSLHKFWADEKPPDSTFIRLYDFGQYINTHPFWSAQIEQIYFTTRHNVELIPRVGAHIIKLGTLENYEYKLNKLMTLYRKGLPIKGWNNYTSIDLSFSNQIICQTK